MDLTQLANLGEFIGGVAVLVTLIYLAVQVRHGQTIARADSEAQATSLWSTHCLQPAIHPGLARIVELGLTAPDGLDEEELRRFRWWIMHYYFMVEGMWRKHQRGLLDKEVWDGVERVIGGTWQSKLVVTFWDHDPVTAHFSDRFLKYMFQLRETTSSEWRVGGFALEPKGSSS